MIKRMDVDEETGEVLAYQPIEGVTDWRPFVRTPYNYDMHAESLKSALDCSVEESKTQQQFKEECDINTIVERFGLTGQLPELNSVRTPLEGDFTTVVDMQQAMNMVRAAEEAFAEMPWEVRSEFGNDPARFNEFISKESNRERARELGLLMPEKVKPEPLEVRLAAAPPGAPGGATGGLEKAPGTSST